MDKEQPKFKVAVTNGDRLNRMDRNERPNALRKAERWRQKYKNRTFF
jgi:hypothetical protein